MVERLRLAALDRDQSRGAAFLFDGLPRLGQLDLLDALVGHGECDRLAV